MSVAKHVNEHLGMEITSLAILPTAMGDLSRCLPRFSRATKVYSLVSECIERLQPGLIWRPYSFLLSFGDIQVTITMVEQLGLCYAHSQTLRT